MTRKKKHSTSTRVEMGYEVEGKLSNLVTKLQDVLRKDPEAKVSIELDWG